MHRLLSLVALAALAGTAAACINDAELPTHEREFRSQYQAPSAPPQAPPPPSHGLPLWGGVALLAGAVGLTLAGGRRRG